MEKPPTFFIPDTEEKDLEGLDAALAAFANGSKVLPIGERIYSIAFEHNGETWTATVGQSMRGVRRTVKKVKGKRIEQEYTLHDNAKVLAIFWNSPYFVVLDGTPTPWANPLYAGEPKSVTRFSTP
jgi:hypothetical protein